LRLLAGRLVELEVVEAISHETARQALKKNELKPWRKAMGCIPPEQDAAFVAQQVLEVYKRPYDAKHPVVCMDEQPKHLISEARASKPAAAGRPARIDYEYVREGVCNVWMLVEPLGGWCR
jgi:hypothetical protein